MRRSGLLGLCLLALAALGAGPGSEDWPAREYRAEAVFSSPASTARPGDPCMETSVHVTVEEIHREDEGRLQRIIVEVVEYDRCAPAELGPVREYYASEPLNPDELTLNRAATRTRLDTHVRACDLTAPHRCLSLRLLLAWDSDSALVVAGPTGWRPAIATGTLSDGERNLSPLPAEFARLEKVR